MKPEHVMMFAMFVLLSVLTAICAIQQSQIRQLRLALGATPYFSPIFDIEGPDMDEAAMWDRTPELLDHVYTPQETTGAVRMPDGSVTNMTFNKQP